MVILKHLGVSGTEAGWKQQWSYDFPARWVFGGSLWKEVKMKHVRFASLCHFVDPARRPLLLRDWPFRRLGAVCTYEIWGLRHQTLSLLSSFKRSQKSNFARDIFSEFAQATGVGFTWERKFIEVGLVGSLTTSGKWGGTERTLLSCWLVGQLVIRGWFMFLSILQMGPEIFLSLKRSFKCLGSQLSSATDLWFPCPKKE